VTRENTVKDTALHLFQALPPRSSAPVRPHLPCYPSFLRRLIINADDFGFTSGVNRAIREAHINGVVTSSTLMANGTAFPEAARLAPQLPKLSIGCHIVLIDGEPVLPSAQLPSLSESNRFRDGLKSFAFRAVTGRMKPDEITAEASAQIRKIQSAGITVSHVDTHKHTHVFPQILRPILRAAAACEVRAIRNPFGPRRPFRSSELLARPNLWTRYAEVRVLRTFSNKFRDSVAREGFATPDGTLGIEVTGALDETLFRAIATTIPDGTWEFVCHPGYNDADLASARTRLRQSRETELHVLTLPSARSLLASEGIELISYRDLVEAQATSKS
jgi:hopanoid biosynthesis associated protein HpnK